jgi:hypothetical protein
MVDNALISQRADRGAGGRSLSRESEHAEDILQATFLEKFDSKLVDKFAAPDDDQAVDESPQDR